MYCNCCSEEGKLGFFYSIINRDRFIRLVIESLRYSGWKDISLEINLRGNLSSIEETRRRIQQAITEKKYYRYEPRVTILADAFGEHPSKEGYIMDIDLSSGYIYFLKTMYIYFLDHLDEIQSSARNDEHIFRFIDYNATLQYTDSMERTIPHEITHLWHKKKSEADKFREISKQRFEKFFKDYVKMRNILLVFQSLYNDFLHDRKDSAKFKKEVEGLIQSLRSFYIRLREEFQYLLRDLCTEGMAEFMTEYILGKLDYNRLEGIARNSCADLANKFPYFIEAFERIVNHLTAVQDKLDTDYFFSPSKEDINFYQGNIQVINNFLEILMYSPYEIGPFIIATLYFNGKLSIEHIGSLSVHQLMKEYVRVCEEHGILPVVANGFFQRGIFNIRKSIAQFNKLRKKLRI